MKLCKNHAVALITVACLIAAYGESKHRNIDDQVRYCDAVAEVRIEWIRVQQAPTDTFEDLFCECSVLQGFKLPVATNKLILRLNFAASPRDYEHKTALLFASANDRGGFSPVGGKLGLVLTNQSYVEYVATTTKTKGLKRKTVEYNDLIRQVKILTKAK